MRDAPAGSAFVVLTHDHALDFLIVAEALEARRRGLCRHDRLEDQEGDVPELVPEDGRRNRSGVRRLVSPIGGNAVKDKRPAVIAALAAAEIMTALVGA